MDDFDYKKDIIVSVDYLSDNGSYSEVGDDSHVDFTEQLVRLGFGDDGIAACVAARLGLSELSVSVGHDVGPNGERLVFVWVRTSTD